MESFLLIVGGALAGIIVLIAIWIALSRWTWGRETARLGRALLVEANAEPPSASMPVPIESLAPDDVSFPPSVLRFKAHTLLERPVPSIESVRIMQTGTFRVGGPDAPWSEFNAVQRFSVRRPGFVWDATIRMPLGLSVWVRDVLIGERPRCGERSSD